MIFKCVTFSVLAAVLTVACGESSPQTSGSEPAVLATTTIWADVVENVSCASPATVEVIIPAGSDPQGFEPS
ncbi:MAG: anchored repeat ABC transporter, substrate-binding protein, partial [Acidimicrobiales bacterium]